MAAATSIVMAAGAGISAINSFSQAKKQKEIANQAEKDAAKFMQEARGKLEVNYADELSLSLAPYERAREQNLVTSSAAMQAGVEGDERGGAATAGKVLQASQKLESDIMDKQIGAMQDLEKASVEEDMALRDAKVNLDLAEHQGAKQEEADARAARQKAIQQGISSVTSAIAPAVGHFAPLWSKGAGNTDLSALGFQSQLAGSPGGGGGGQFNLQMPTGGQQLGGQQTPFQLGGGSNYTGLNQFSNQNPYDLGGGTTYTGLNMFPNNS